MRMIRRTKIICTMGPATTQLETILELIDAGMNVARLNFSHGTHEDHKKMIDNLKKAREMRGVSLAIMLDTKGPEVRVGRLKKDPLPLKKGEKVLLVPEETSDPAQIPITPRVALDPIEEGHCILFDDGYIVTIVLEKKAKGLLVEVQNEGILKSQKGVNIPGVKVPLPAMTEKDIEDIKFGCSQDIDLIAASFIRSAEHVREIRHLLYELKKSDIHIISKIENSLGVQNFEAIVQVSDGIMIARGDLGVELPIEEVPALQKMMIRKCVHTSKPVITATQMLESMIHNPMPTRAEASDVANAIYDSTSAVMLSGETAVGKYPIKTVHLMRRIIEESEKDFSFIDFFYQSSRIDSHDISSSISMASVKTAYSLGAKAIFAFTSGGTTARFISRFRPKMPIVALTSNPKTYHQLAFAWGVIPANPTHVNNAQEALEVTSHFAREEGIVTYGDLVVMTAGSPFGVTGTTNMMRVESIGEVLVRGHEGEGERIKGKIAIVLTPDEYAAKRAKGTIVVISKYEEDYHNILEDAKGIILQNHPEDYESEDLILDIAKEKAIPVIVRADEALRRLRDGQRVILDPKKGIVYKATLVLDDEEMIGLSD